MDVSPVGTHPRNPRAGEIAKCIQMQRYGLKGKSFTYILHHRPLVIEVDQIGDRTWVGLFNPTTLTITTGRSCRSSERFGPSGRTRASERTNRGQKQQTSQETHRVFWPVV